MNLWDLVSSGRLKEMKVGARVLQNWLEATFYLPVLENRDAFFRQKEKIAASLVDTKMGKLAKRVRLLPADEAIMHNNYVITQHWSYLNFIASFWERFDQLSENLKINLVYQSGANFTRKKLEDCPKYNNHFVPVFQEFSSIEKLLQREVWIIDLESGDWYLLLDYSFNHKPFEKNYIIGSVYEGTIIPFPFEGSQRCIDIDLRRISKELSLQGGHTSLRDVNDKIFSLIAENPFLERFPIMLEMRSEYRDGKWYLYDTDGQCIPIMTAESHMKFITVGSACFFSPKVVCGIWSPAGFNPFCIIKGNRIISAGFEQ
ncbi:hypothetical protein [Membranihabitans maritimus]|uniref:hypothetical protein n=1 Tax=Membranihabitans maritimus TaxID=2904244 RepID=UPI001F2CF003|nr:hypothetical protein [Membranihabitans maritimus]